MGLARFWEGVRAQKYMLVRRHEQLEEVTTTKRHLAYLAKRREQLEEGKPPTNESCLLSKPYSTIGVDGVPKEQGTPNT
jgi:hypothetical protein